MPSLTCHVAEDLESGHIRGATIQHGVTVATHRDSIKYIFLVAEAR
jgi:hypothetical protein